MAESCDRVDEPSAYMAGEISVDFLSGCRL